MTEVNARIAAVSRIRSGQDSREKVMRELGVSRQTITNWMGKYRPSAPPQPSQNGAEYNRIIADLKLENEALRALIREIRKEQ